jgi:hypothetical protein
MRCRIERHELSRRDKISVANRIEYFAALRRCAISVISGQNDEECPANGGTTEDEQRTERWVNKKIF